MIFKDINIYYGKKVIYKNYELNIDDNKVTAIIGKSGIGKTSLLRYISDFLLKENIRFSYVFQEDRLIPWMSIKNNLDMIYDETCNIDTIEALKIVGLIDSINRYPIQLSGGMRQRVNLARALMKPGEVMLLDEPFKSLDFKTKESLMKYFNDLIRKNNITCVFVTHNLEEADSLADKIINIE